MCYHFLAVVCYLSAAVVLSYITILKGRGVSIVSGNLFVAVLDDENVKIYRIAITAVVCLSHTIHICKNNSWQQSSQVFCVFRWCHMEPLFYTSSTQFFLPSDGRRPNKQPTPSTNQELEQNGIYQLTADLSLGSEWCSLLSTTF